MIKQLAEAQESNWFTPLIITLIIWELTWKMIAMWRAAQFKQPVWFVLLGVLNTLGIFPILYMLFFKGKKPLV